MYDGNDGVDDDDNVGGGYDCDGADYDTDNDNDGIDNAEDDIGDADEEIAGDDAEIDACVRNGFCVNGVDAGPRR